MVGPPGRIQRVMDILDTHPKRLGAILKRAASRPLTINWRHALRPRTLFAWDDDEDDGQSRRHSSTAWLDGARGVSAAQVYIFHFVVNGYAYAAHTYGAKPEYNHYYQHALLRPIWNAGAGSVCNFFIISGYALTTKCFVLMREGKFDELYRGLCSSVLRRWFRLWLPVIAVAAPMIFMYQYFPYMGPYQPTRRDSLWEEITNFIYNLNEAAQPFPFMNKNGVGWSFNYVNQAWTIPLEFHCSMICYLVAMLVSQIPTFRYRAVIMGFLAFYAMHHAIYWTCLFLVGMLLADWDLEQHYRQKNQTPGLPWQPNGDANHTTNTNNHTDTLTTPTPSYTNQTIILGRPITLSTLLNATIFFTGYYLSGMPMQTPEETPYTPKLGYEFLYRLQPPKWLFNIDFELRYYQSLSAICLIYATSQSSTLKRMFESRFCQWLGKLSFSLYLVHVQIMGMMAWPLRVFFGVMTMHTEGLSAVMFVFEFVVMSFVVLVVAVAVWRGVDVPTVRFARWVDAVLTGKRRGGSYHQVSTGQELAVLPGSRVEARVH